VGTEKNDKETSVRLAKVFCFFIHTILMILY
jgi:hypothetical protein